MDWTGFRFNHRFRHIPFFLFINEQVKEKVYHSLHKLHGGAEVIMDEAKDKVLDAGTKAADKVADGTFKVAEKADEMKNKVHSYADNAKK